MINAFKELNNEKQQKIMNAALHEFADKGCENASTNVIVKNADISKGILFYYFGDKRGLYAYLADYGINTIRCFLDKIDETETDLFERFKSLSALKFELLTENPQLFNFLGSIVTKQDYSYLAENTLERIAELKKIMDKKLYSNIDTSLFRKDIPADEVIKIVKFCMDGCEKNFSDRLKIDNSSRADYSPYWQEFYRMLEMLKTILYQN